MSNATFTLGTCPGTQRAGLAISGSENTLVPAQALKGIPGKLVGLAESGRLFPLVRIFSCGRQCSDLCAVQIKSAGMVG